MLKTVLFMYFVYRLRKTHKRYVSGEWVVAYTKSQRTWKPFSAQIIQKSFICFMLKSKTGLGFFYQKRGWFSSVFKITSRANMLTQNTTCLAWSLLNTVGLLYKKNSQTSSITDRGSLLIQTGYVHRLSIT